MAEHAQMKCDQARCFPHSGQTTEDCAEGDAANKGEAENDASGDEKEAAGENEAETPDGGEDRVSTRSTKVSKISLLSIQGQDSG